MLGFLVWRESLQILAVQSEFNNYEESSPVHNSCL